MNQKDTKSIIESLLFISSKPLSPEQIKKILPETDIATIKLLLKKLHEEYKNRDGGFLLAEISKSYQFRTTPKNKEWVKKLSDSPPLTISKATLETLTIIAYKQPLIRSDIEHIRGVDSGGTIRNLLDMKLIKVLGRKEIPGRPLIYTTTAYFLEFFNLQSISDLPSLDEIATPDKQNNQEK